MNTSKSVSNETDISKTSKNKESVDKAGRQSRLDKTLTRLDLVERLLTPTKTSLPENALPSHIPHKNVFKYSKWAAPISSTKFEPISGLKAQQRRDFRKRDQLMKQISGDIIDFESDTTMKAAPGEEEKASEATMTILTKPTISPAWTQELVHRKKKKPIVTCDLKAIIADLRARKDFEFFYLVWAVPLWSEFYTPYCLKIVTYENVDKNNFLTISTHGVTHNLLSDMLFTPIDEWEREYDMYLRLIKIKTFALFITWKSFYVWHKNIRWFKFMSARVRLSNTLLILSPILGQAVLEIIALCCKMISLTFLDVSIVEKNILQTFQNNQLILKKKVEVRLIEFRDLTKQIVNNACHGLLLKVGYTHDDSNLKVPDELVGTIAMRGIKTTRDGKYRMTYADRALKKQTCALLASFIQMIDFIVQNVLHNLVKTALKDLVKLLQHHLSYLPSDDLIKAANTHIVLEEIRATGSKFPLFLIDLEISLENLILNPSYRDFLDAFNCLMKDFETICVNIPVLLADPFFDPFTEPTVCGRQEERICGLGPNLQFVLNDDNEIQSMKTIVLQLIDKNFNAIFLYIEHFKNIHLFYFEDETLDIKVITEQTDLEQLRELLDRYHREKDAVEEIVPEQAMGMVLLQLQLFKEKIFPTPEKLLEIVENTLPRIGRGRIDALTKEADSALEYLQLEPKTTLHFVQYLEFLDKIAVRVDEMDNELGYCKDLYDLIEEYVIAVSPDDVNAYYDFGDELTTLHNLVEKLLNERPQIVELFNNQISKDIGALIEELAGIREEAVQPWLTDVESNPETAKATLAQLSDQLIQCQEQATQYKLYQKTFKVEVTRFDVLDEVMNDVKLRQLLWESIENWDKNMDDWSHNEFSTLVPDDMNQTTAKFMKYIVQFEKGLPENLIVPKLKERVERLKDKLPVITTLRNPNLKPRHWMEVERILNTKFSTEVPLTLEMFEELKAFTFFAELQEISGQASSEAGLEALLRKVEDAWKALEFVVLPHKEAKDVFILGSTEEVQTALDESNINMNTIASSRHVGPIKPRVDDWILQLELFSKTLDEWLECQTNWLYLEAIFSAPDIQKQLPLESKMFLQVDKSWKEIMRRTAKNPLAITACTYPGLLEVFHNNNNLLDQILKCLEAYLESKRVVFPRFYFLSNEELIEILAQTRNPHAVQPHLRKCFDAISKLEFGTKMVPLKDGEEEGEMEEVLTTDIVAMISPENETVSLGKGLKARGNVEDWLGKVEESMFLSLRRQMREALLDYSLKPRVEWVLDHPSQIVLTVSQCCWCTNVHKVLETRSVENVKEFEKQCFKDLNNLAAMVRGDVPKLKRSILCSLITIDVHARDIISTLVQSKVTSSINFEWQKQLRYYFEKKSDTMVARMANAYCLYGYEYLGASPRLVITPLTDKCYLCLMGALQLDLGGAPAGPAGTGKTETTKDLAKSLAVQCVVFNCSEGLDYKMMGRFFSGLAQSGAWCCFDEFNRIDIEVLSVIAQQLITIRNAKVAKVARFLFEGREIKLVKTCAAFITMNPGYAGRTELPDNLKSLFRPMAMMVPDYGLIAEVILYSEGFESSKGLAQKMVNMYKLCSEQLSQQDHYDFGMRAVKSVLVMAGSLKRENPDKNEDVVLIRALRDSNLPKFLRDDALLFQGILSDLFPGVVLPKEDYGLMESTIRLVMENENLQPESCFITKVIQLYETMIVRHGVMTVGPTGGGKTTVLNVLKWTLTKLHDLKVEGQYYRPVISYTLNPKSVTMGELYGEVNTLTLEWKDGLLGIFVRITVQCTEEVHQWVVCDGPVDAVWIENMNTVLDDNKMLCLANSERIKLTPWVHMLFEVQDLSQASPATVSRCGMVYIDPEELRWMPYVQTWLAKLTSITPLQNEYIPFLEQLFSTATDLGLYFVKKQCSYAIKQVEISKISMLCSLFQSLICEPGLLDKNMDRSRARTIICQTFIFSYLWSLGGNLIDSSREKFEVYVREQFEENPDAHMPAGTDLWDLYINVQQHRLEPWIRVVPSFIYNTDTAFFEMLVPTIDTVRFGYVMEKLLNVNHPVIFTGTTGVGKSVVARNVLNNLFKSGQWVPVFLNFSAQTSSTRTQEILESKLERKKKTLLGAQVGKRVVVFVDDVNMPKLETYGAQPPIELLRQFLDFKGFYDREKMFWKDIHDMVLCAACAPPGGGRNPLTPRFIRHFAMLLIPSPNETTLKVIFRSILRGFLSDFSQKISDLADSLVSASVEIYNRITEDLLPTPAKSHYVFNLRDLSKCIQGILQADSGTMRESNEMLRLFYHECLRVFHDRLVNLEDKTYFYNLMKEICQRSFATPVIIIPSERKTIGRESIGLMNEPPVLLFGDFMVQTANKEDRVYEEIRDINKLKGVLQDFLMDFNLLTSKEMKLIFFMDAIEHVTRLARLLRAERGNGLLVGVGGMGKQSLTKLGAHLNGYKCFQIEMTRSYDYNSFHEDLRHLYFSAGALNEDTVFLFTDTQIVAEEFLEDINNILNTGEVANLFESDEYEKVIIACRPPAKEAGVLESNRDGIFDYFISRVRSKLHLVICMSPVGDAFRRRCRMFPSLVNCCTIDWFVDWPEEALISVAQDSFQEMNEKELIAKMSSMCYTIHASVGNMTVRFYEEMRRHYYVTPSSYLELLKLYKFLLNKKTVEITRIRDRIKNGLTKLFETNALVDTMKVQLIALEPQLKEKSAATALLMKSLIKEKAQADEVRQVVVADEAIVKVKAAEIQVLADEAQHDLDLALPEMEEAAKALEALNKSDINELRVFNKPPHLVKFVLEAVCLLLGAKTDWASAKIVLGDIAFLKKLQDYDKDHIPDSLLKKLKEYIEHPEFRPDLVATQSKVCRSLCTWVRAVDNYSKIFRIVDPKRRKVEAAERELSDVMVILRQKQQNLADVEAQIAKLEAVYDASVAEKASLEATMIQCSSRLGRAGRLTMALGDEQVRWEQSVETFKSALVNLTGDVLVAAACIAYVGAFTSDYREELTELWVQKLKLLEVPASPSFSLITVLADPYEIRMWNSCGLPRDDVSTENAILVTQAGRWPLLIDPQEQANRWIRQMESSNNLKIVKLTDSNFMRILEAGIRIGMPVLLEEVGETLDPTLGPILLKQTFVQGGRTLIRLGDSDIEYDNNFRLYVTTKLSNPHYLPEICIQVTLVNFTVTPSGLEDQLLADVVRLERPDLEKQRTELIVRINNDKGQLKGIEDKILKLLFASEGNILDDEELVETLNESKETAAIIASRLMETEATEEKISIAREKYRTVASRGSCLYFVVAILANIDPMYQFSLKYFNQVFNTVITTSPPSAVLAERLEILLEQITLSVYTNVSRGLFERHKLVFSFMLCTSIFKQAGKINEQQWNFLIRGPVGGTVPGLPKKPDIAALSEAQWNSVNYLAIHFPKFKKLPEEVINKIPITVGDFDQVIDLNPKNSQASNVDWNSKLDMFERMMVLKSLKEEKLVFAITEYVKTQLGKEFVESPLVSLHLLYQDTTNTTPLVFVLSTGSDPVGAFQRFAADTGNKDRIQSISLGQGQGPIAEKLIDAGKKRGDWVFLQNCHLASSWMLAMERTVLALQENPREVQPEFRLFLSSMPTASFPASILQNSVKVTNEPPKGLRANVKRAFIELTEPFFEDHPLESKWRKMIFGLCFFHAIVQERKKFGPLGWNILYEFNDSDRECALLTLQLYCSTSSLIPWDALEYITGEITYGGRVTDYWDQRTLKTVLQKFFCSTTLKSDYKYSPSGIYYCPDSTSLVEYRNFIEDLPIIEEPEIFGMHENANIAYQTNETAAVIVTIMEIQPRESAGVEGKSSDDIVYEISDLIISRIIKKIDEEQARTSVVKLDAKGRKPSLTTVLFQEVDRFNRMLYIIHGSLNDLQKAIKGLVVMSEALEEVYKAFINNQVPKMWAKCSYPSLKSLGSWIKDLELRLDFVYTWLLWGNPPSFWLSGFFFPQGFVTGALQAHARKYDLPIDQLKVDFQVSKIFLDQESIAEVHKAEGKEVKSAYGRIHLPENGVFVHGLFLDAARFDTSKLIMAEQHAGEMNPPLPALHLVPVTELNTTTQRYEAPLYKTSVRAGVLSTTGHSTNFVITVFLPTDKPPSHWILRGAALLTQITD